MTNTTFKSKEELSLGLKNIITNLGRDLELADQVMTEEGAVLQNNSYHFLAKILKPSSNRLETTFHKILFGLAHQAEMQSAGAGYLSTVFAIDLLDTLFKRQDTFAKNSETDLLQQYKTCVAALQKETRKLSVRAKQDDVKRIITDICQNEDLSTAVEQATELAGVEGNIHMEDSKQPSYMVELKHGYEFDLRPFKFFIPTTGIWEEENVRVLIMDGMIEQVSEIEHLLMKTIDSKQPMVIIAQGFSEEVVATLKTNQDRGVFNIMPIRMQPDLEGLNVLNDIASVVGGDVLSALKGEQLSCREYDTIPVVDKVLVAQNKTVFNNNKTRKNVAFQIKHIFTKRSQPSTVEDVSDLYDKRLKSLLAHTVVLRFPNMSNTKLQSSRVKVDICLRTIKTVLSNGTVDFKVVANEMKNDPLIGEAILKTARRIDAQTLPTLTVLTGIYYAGQTMLTILSSAGIIEIDD